MDKEKLTRYTEFAKEIRRDILKMVYEKKAGFVGTSFSCADVLAVLFQSFLKFDPKNPEAEDNDLFILSKGHGASAWYAVLANMGAFPKERLFAEFNTSGYQMGVHPKRNSLPGIKTSSGSLGQGLGMACGAALADKIQKKKNHTFVLLGDGECNEGSVWESFLFASRFQLDNLTVIIDRNHLQSYAHDEQVLCMGDLATKLTSFGFYAMEIDGHNYEALDNAFTRALHTEGMPSVIVADTIKGKGVKKFEDKVLWHYKWPEAEDYDQGLKELR